MLNLLEVEVLNKLLDGTDKNYLILKNQVKNIVSISRELTGSGVFTRFEVSLGVEKTEVQNFSFGDVLAEIDGLKYGAGFLLYVENGVMTCLESYTYEECWPLVVDKFVLRYTNVERDENLLYKFL